MSIKAQNKKGTSERANIVRINATTALAIRPVNLSTQYASCNSDAMPVLFSYLPFAIWIRAYSAKGVWTSHIETQKSSFEFVYLCRLGRTQKKKDGRAPYWFICHLPT